jgi:hypothetical protein
VSLQQPSADPSLTRCLQSSYRRGQRRLGPDREGGGSERSSRGLDLSATDPQRAHGHAQVVGAETERPPRPRTAVGSLKPFIRTCHPAKLATTIARNRTDTAVIHAGVEAASISGITSSFLAADL